MRHTAEDPRAEMRLPGTDGDVPRLARMKRLQPTKEHQALSRPCACRHPRAAPRMQKIDSKEDLNDGVSAATKGRTSLGGQVSDS